MWPKQIFIDTSMWLVYIDTDDAYHSTAVETFSKHIKEGDSFFTSNDVIDETVTRLKYDTTWQKTERFLEFIGEGIARKRIVQLWTDEEIQEEAFGVIKRFKDHKLSLTDATSVAIMKRFHLDAIFTLDSDFKKIGISSLPR